MKYRPFGIVISAVALGILFLGMTIDRVKIDDNDNRESNSIQQQEWVDLGLPSGTLWKQRNESGPYSYYHTVKYYDGFLPTSGQFQELIDYCSWEWTGQGCKVIGRNGNSIYLSAEFMSADYGKARAAYWSATKDPSRSDCCYGLLFDYVDDQEEMMDYGLEYARLLSKVDRTCGIDNEKNRRSVILCIKK